jgi:two-component system phosphate regulon response regulator PhoB
MTRILVADANRPLAHAVAAALRREGLTVDTCHDGVAADLAVTRNRPTVVVLDALLPQVTGLALCRRLRGRAEGNEVAVLVVTAWCGIEDKVAAFEAGCDDFLGKPFDVRELVSRVHALRRRYQPAEEHLVRVGEVELNCRTAEVAVGGRAKLLTPVEFELLQFLMTRPGQAFSSTALLAQVWGYPNDAGNNDLVRVHIHNLRAKLEEDPASPVFLRTRPRHGYFVSAEPLPVRVDAPV